VRARDRHKSRGPKANPAIAHQVDRSGSVFLNPPKLLVLGPNAVHALRGVVSYWAFSLGFVVLAGWGVPIALAGLCSARVAWFVCDELVGSRIDDRS
jgi:hypothetical protein